jgi:hypothetical protein
MPWDLTGNSGTNPETDFLGTRDNQPLVIRTNGTEALRIDGGSGSIVIGDSTGIEPSLGFSPRRVSVVGKVACKVDARHSPIEVGAPLTTSSTPGHAMKANDAVKAFGAVLGKALRPLEQGQGIVPILVALQ